jgi:Flp pilus assembly protein TadG
MAKLPNGAGPSKAMGRSGTFLSRLASDTRGNVLAIAAASTIPLIGMIGAGVDVSRAYLAKNRLQQACDAGVLAGRKLMIDSVNPAVTAEVRKFVNFNFPQRTLETTPFVINPTEGTNEAINLTLQTSLPTELVKVLGVTSFPISATCTARQDFVNTDIMLVLDTTLSMNCLPSEAASTYCPTEKSSSKMRALRDGVIELYRSLRDPQTRLEGAGLRLRYGIVPYSVTVNTGKLVQAKNASWIRNPAIYQVCNYDRNGNCDSVSARSVSHDAAWLSSWSGCIEERATPPSIRATSGYTAPTGAHDLDIDSAPTSEQSKWAPYDPATVTAKSGYPGIDSACPKASRALAPIATQADMSTYLNSMTAGGYTYHDIGLIWGARLISPTGMWSSDNPTTFNTFPVNRHMIFMTDGAMDPDLYTYSAYGVEAHSAGGRRITADGNAARQLESHIQRFRIMCNKIKGMDISLWVIAFGTSTGTGLSDELKNCASSHSQAFKADNQAGLNERFRQIGESIGALRLSE